MAKILGKTHKSNVLGADTHSVSLINTTKLYVDLSKNLINMLMKYLYIHHVAK